MVCPKCNDEYQDGFTMCGKCKVPLIVPEHESEPEPEPEPEDTFYVTDDVPAFLCTAKNHIEANAIEAVMKCHDIPVLLKPRDCGDITMLYMGVSFTDTDVYVPSKLITRAKELLEHEPAHDNENDAEFDELKQSHKENLSKKAMQLRWFFFIIWGVPIIVLLFTLLRFSIN